MTSLLLGSISTVADTSEQQRSAFNRAFEEHGLDWHWDAETYRDLLADAGGRRRIAEWADRHGETVDADAVHATKSRLFREAIVADGLDARPGVVETVRATRDAGGRVAFVTTTSADNVDAVIRAVRDLDRDMFDLVLSADDAEAGKPDPAIYRTALAELGVNADEAIAVEDNVDGVAAATAAGLTCLAFPNENTTDHDFGEADRVVDELDPELVT